MSTTGRRKTTQKLIVKDMQDQKDSSSEESTQTEQDEHLIKIALLFWVLRN